MKYSTWSQDAALAVLATLREEKGAVNNSRADVHGVLTYYHDLLTEPPGDNHISVCVAEACQAVGSRQLEKDIKAKFGKEVHDGYCFGNCALGPCAMVNGAIIGRASVEKIEKVRV
jgi:formate dehydrogenase subunit gamma